MNENRPKLIILNGPSGVGKSTVAARLHDEMPLSLLVDIDMARKQISNHREYRKESLALAYEHALAVVESHLKSGNSVIVDKAIVSAPAVLESLVDLGEKYDADVHEFILMASKEIVLQRAHSRGFREKSLLTPQKAEEIWEKAATTEKLRHNATVIDTNKMDADAVYEEVKKVIHQIS